MTAITVTGSAFGSRSTRLRLTARGRRVLTAVAALPAAIALGIAVISGGAAIAGNDAGTPADSFYTVTVSPGESLWSIAESIAPGADPRDVVDAIANLNGLQGGAISAGQELAIPADYAPVP